MTQILQKGNQLPNSKHATQTDVVAGEKHMDKILYIDNVARIIYNNWM